MGILLDGLELGVHIFFEGKESVNNLNTHLVVIGYFIFVYSVVLYVSKQRALHSEDVGDVELIEECSSC